MRSHEILTTYPDLTSEIISFEGFENFKIGKICLKVTLEICLRILISEVPGLIILSKKCG